MKEIILYDPRTNISTKTTIFQIADLLERTVNSLYTAKSKRQKLGGINCYILPSDISPKERQALYAKETFEDEAWKIVEGSDEQFLISNYGRFQRIYKKHQKLLYPYLRKANGSLQVKVKFHGRYGEYKISQLVAHHFIAPRQKGQIVRHKNGIKTDDFVGNLEYISRQKLGKLTGYTSKSKPVVQLNNSGEVINEFRSAREAGRECFVSYQTVLDYCKGARKNRQTDLNFMFEQDYENEWGIL